MQQLLGLMCDPSAAMQEEGTPKLVEAPSDAEKPAEMPSVSSPQTVMELDEPLPLNRCLREPFRSSDSAHYKQHVVYLTQKIIRSYCNSFKAKAFYTSNSSGCNHDSNDMLLHCNNGIQDPQGVRRRLS